MDMNSLVATVVHPRCNSLPALAKQLFFFAVMHKKRAAMDHTEALEVGAQQELVGGKEIWQYSAAL